MGSRTGEEGGSDGRGLLRRETHLRARGGTEPDRARRTKASGNMRTASVERHCKSGSSRVQESAEKEHWDNTEKRRRRERGSKVNVNRKKNVHWETLFS